MHPKRDETYSVFNKQGKCARGGSIEEALHLPGQRYSYNNQLG